MSAMLDFVLMMQPAATAMGGSGGGASGGCGGGGGMQQLVLLPVMLVIMYFLMIRPQQQQQKEHDSMLKKLKTGDIVRTDSGIRGEIVKIGDRDVELLVAERTKINLLRSRIAGLEGTPAAQAATSAKSE